MSSAGDLTLSLHGRSKRKPGEPSPKPLLIVALECCRPHALSTRHLLTGISSVVLGRGGERVVERRQGADTGELTIRIPDRWMSSQHARIEHSFGRWVLEDTNSKNGTVVNGAQVQRAVLRDGDIVELGHTLLLFRDTMPVGDDDPDDVDLAATPPASAEVRGMVTLVPQLARTLDKLERVSGSDIPILIVGESGTGKEVLAHAVHSLSARRGEFVAVNCGAIPENLVESELFGHRKGAFSGATEDRLGLIRSAHGGTLFLDEIGDLPSPSQAALLRVLQEHEVMPVGGTKPVPVDVRLVSATHRDLEDMVERGLFRHDLYARITGFRIEVPPLRERREDLGLLVGKLLPRVVVDDGEHPGLDCDAARQLFTYSWPLNIRELENALGTASVLAGSEPIALEHLPPTVRGVARAPSASNEEGSAQSTLRLSADDARRRNDLMSAMREHKGNISAVARVLGKDRKQIQRWIKRFKLDPDGFK